MSSGAAGAAFDSGFWTSPLEPPEPCETALPAVAAAAAGSSSSSSSFAAGLLDALPAEPPLVVHDVRLPGMAAAQSVSVVLQHGVVHGMECTGAAAAAECSRTNVDGGHGLVLPSLCHPHIHLDKPYLHSLQVHPWIATGEFAEAVALTDFAKDAYTPADLLARGRRLVLDSVAAGVTCMRAHVEVDLTVGTKCVDAGLALKREFGPAERGICDVQIAVFAQDPVFKGSEAQQQRMRRQVFSAVEKPGVDVIGTAPYVEESVEKAKLNIEWAVDMAMLHRKHLDLHLDYSLDPKDEPMVHFLIKTLVDRHWNTVMPKHLTITLGHCTRLSLYQPYQLRQLKKEIADSGLPIYFVGLPTSDLYMMGRDIAGGPSKGGGCIPRGTIPVLDWIKTYDFDVSLGINNVGNAFTPFGSVDPLAMIAGIGNVYQGGTEEDCRILLECITTRAKRAIGMLDENVMARGKEDGLMMRIGDRGDMVVVSDQSRQVGIIDTAVDPGYDRIVIKGGRIVARRQMQRWFA